MKLTAPFYYIREGLFYVHRVDVLLDENKINRSVYMNSPYYEFKLFILTYWLIKLIHGEKGLEEMRKQNIKKVLEYYKDGDHE